MTLEFSAFFLLQIHCQFPAANFLLLFLIQLRFSSLLLSLARTTDTQWRHVCMYVCINLFLRHRSISQIPYYEKYIRFLSQSYSTNECKSFLSSPGLIDHLLILDVHPNLLFLSNSFCWGTYFLKIFLILRKKVISGGHWFYVPPTEPILWFDLVGHSIVIRSMYFINFGKSFYFYDLYVFLFGRGYIYIRIISTFNRCFRLCSFFDGVIDWTYHVCTIIHKLNRALANFALHKYCHYFTYGSQYLVRAA